MYNSIFKITAISIFSLSLTACFNDSHNKTVNTPPTTISVDLITQADTPIVEMVTAADVDMDILTFSVISEPTNGMLTLNSSGQFTYRPNATVTGKDSFVFGVTDGNGSIIDGTVNITIEALQVNFSSYSRTVFAQDENDTPLPVNGREFTQNVTDANAYDDLLNNQ